MDRAEISVTGHQAAAVLRDADSPYTLERLADALAETVNWLSRADGDALSHIPGD